MNLWALALAVILLLGNGFFVGAEFALLAARRTQIEPRAEDGSRMAALALRAMSSMPLMVAGAQLGITICSLGLGAVAEPAIAHQLEGPFDDLGVPHSAVHPASFVIALLIVTFCHTVIGEMVPKNIALAGPDRLVLALGPPMLWFCLGTRHILGGLMWFATRFLGLFRITPPDETKSIFTAEELASLVSQSRTEGLLDPDDERRITSALTLTERTAADVMKPWSQAQTVPASISPATLEVLANRTGLSRFPVVEQTTRTVRGFVHVKDTLPIDGDARRKPLRPDAIRPLTVVPRTITLADLLLLMQRGRAHLAIVSEGGRPVGFVTLNDVLRGVVGGEATASEHRSE